MQADAWKSGDLTGRWALGTNLLAQLSDQVSDAGCRSDGGTLQQPWEILTYALVHGLDIKLERAVDPWVAWVSLKSLLPLEAGIPCEVLWSDLLFPHSRFVQSLEKVRDV
jgi:hypothetical protein